MIKNLILSLLICSLPHFSNAATDNKDLHQSINKIIVYGKNGSIAVATAFALNYNNNQYLVTNNHVCDGFYKSEEVFLASSGQVPGLQRTIGAYYNLKLPVIKEYYMHPGSDICLMKVRVTYPGLALASKGALPTDQILISGFVGRSWHLMFVDGKVYGDLDLNFPNNLLSCALTPPKSSASAFTCVYYPQYPDYIKRTLQVGVNNIGPGFSGSPVLKNGEVVGLVSAYFPPDSSSGYYNGDVIFWPLPYLHEALKASKDNFIPTHDNGFEERNKVYRFDSEVLDFTLDFQNQLEDLVLKLLKRNND